MKDHDARLLPKYALERAKSFRQGAAKRFAEAFYMLSRALVWYWIHFQIVTIRAGSAVSCLFLALVGLQRRTKTEACATPFAGESKCDAVEVETPNV